jgi:hypothetical protein
MLKENNMKKQTLQELIDEILNNKIPCDCPKGGLVGEEEKVCEKCGGSEWIIDEKLDESLQKILQWIVDKMPQKRCLHELTELHNEGTSGSQTCISCNKYFKNKEAKEIDISENYGHNECLEKILSPIKSVLNKK